MVVLRLPLGVEIEAADLEAVPNYSKTKCD